jgi:NitT/TauT family transport system ATP-binding protein
MSISEELENVVPAKLAVEQVSKRFSTGRSGEVQALDAVSLQVNVGGFVCLVGPSGCRKSTLLNIIAGLEKPDNGQVLADGKPITEPGRDRMMMFQESALFPWLDVMGNVLFGLKLKPGLKAKERREVAEFYLKLVGLERFMHANIHQLSGGMKQRVALARALAPNPRVLLMDEPFASLDALTRQQLYGDIQKDLAKSQKDDRVRHTQRSRGCMSGQSRHFVFTTSGADPRRVQDRSRKAARYQQCSARELFDGDHARPEGIRHGGGRRMKRFVLSAIFHRFACSPASRGTGENLVGLVATGPE